MLGRCRRDQGSGSPAQLIPVQCNLLRRGAAAACTNHRTAVWVCSLLSQVLSSRLMQCKYFYPLYLLSSCCYTRHFTIHYFASTEDDGIHIMHPNPPQP